MLFLALEQVKHTLNQVVDVEQLYIGVSVVDGIWQVVRNSVAEGRDRAVIIRAAVPHQVREAINRDLGTGFLAVSKQQLLSCQLAFAVVRLTVTTDKRLLLAVVISLTVSILIALGSYQIFEKRIPKLLSRNK